MAAMLDQIDQVKDVPDKLSGYIENKFYLHATDLLVSAVLLLENELSEVGSLRNIKIELTAKKEELHEVLIDELHKQLYIKSTSSVVKGFQRHGSIRKEKMAQMQQGIQGADEPMPELDIMAVNLEEVAQPKDMVENLTVDPEEDTVHFIAILMESLARLQKLPEAVEAIKTRIRPGLLAIVQRASQQVADNVYSEGENIASVHQPEYLLELLELVFQEFRVVAQVHQIVLANLKRIILMKTANSKSTSASPSGDWKLMLYDSVDIWSKIQAVVQLLLSDYLDIRNTASTHVQGSGNFDEPSTGIGLYFARKRPTRPKKYPFFRFEASSHAISMNSYLREQRQEFYGSGEVLRSHENLADIGKQQFVCKPGASNIEVIYNPVHKFMKEIEAALGCQAGTCTLQVFIIDFVKNVFLNQVHNNIIMNIDAATKGFDAQRVIIEPRTQKELGSPKPLLQSTVAVDRNLQELKNMMHDLPDYADQFLNMICKTLHDYKETCIASYRDIVQSDPEEKRIISAFWAKDEDISRFLRCLPNWQNLKEEAQPTNSEEDQRAWNSKESDILTSNLSSSETLIPPNEIISDVVQLRTLGNLCESLDWFANRIKALAGSLSTSKERIQVPGGADSPTGEPPAVSESTLESLLALAGEFEDLSEVCLLVLHLETRVHCFYYLLPMAKQSNYSGAIDDMDPDSSVIKLNKDLAGIEEVMTQSLQPKRFKYVFEGLGHLVASILINSTQFLKRINENGIKKMCRNIFAVQQSLTNITMNRESDLDHARQYYELLYLSPDEIIAMVIEHGPQFSELEYVNILNLHHRSRPGVDPSSYNAKLQRLKEILADSRCP